MLSHNIISNHIKKTHKFHLNATGYGLLRWHIPYSSIPAISRLWSKFHYVQKSLTFKINLNLWAKDFYLMRIHLWQTIERNMLEKIKTELESSKLSGSSLPLSARNISKLMLILFLILLKLFQALWRFFQVVF